jgi:tetratricopeptide (TPR) repeat protein
MIKNLKYIGEAKMKKNQFMVLFVSILFVLFFSGPKLGFAQKDGEGIVIGKYKTIHSSILNEERLLFVHLPREYKDTQLRYPVMVLLYVDIYNYFADAAIITEKLGGTGEIPSVIIIGVANTNRYRDLLPLKTRFRREGGGAINFLSFIEKELIPYIDKTYRTKNFRILAGPQTAAVFSLYALIKKPNLFNAIISENPFMGPEISAFLYPKAEQFILKQNALKGFYYIKCEKNERPQDLEYAGKFSKLLESKQISGFNFNMKFREPSGYFITPLPFKNGLRTLFNGHKLPEKFETHSVKDIITYYKKLSADYGFEVDPPSLLLTFEGGKLRQKRKTREAIELFKYQLSLYPKSLNALFQLGETYRGMGKLEDARVYYKKFLDIEDRDVAMIRYRLNQVEKMIKGSAVYRMEQAIRTGGIQAGIEKYESIKSDPNTKLYFEENEFNALGYRLMGAGEMKEAIEIFKLNVELYPKSANAYDSLGEAYMKGGDKQKAIKNYKKSLELNPKNTNAKEMLKKLEEE